MSKWHYSKDNQQHGPVTAAVLKQLAAAGALGPDDLVWQEGMPKWVPAKQLKGLFAAATPGDPSKPPPLPTKPSPPVVSGPIATEPVPQIQVKRAEPQSAERTQPTSNSLRQANDAVAQQRRAIVDLVQREGADAGLPAVQEFRRNTTKLAAEQEAVAQRMQKVQEAAAAFAAKESDLKAKNDELGRHQAALEKLAQPLGKAAFAALHAGQIQPHPALATRVELQAKLDQLKQEYEALAAPANASIFDKTKAGGQQLLVTGKVKLEELKIGGIDASVGKLLMDANSDADVRCAETSAILDQVVQVRSALEAGRGAVKQAEVALNVARKQIGDALAMQASAVSKDALSAEATRCRSATADFDQQTSQAAQVLCQQLIANEAQITNPQLGQLVRSLKSTLAESASWESKRVAANARQKRFLLTAGGIAGGGVLVLLALCCGILGFASQRMQQAASQALAEANGMWNSGQQADAVDKYREVLDEYWSLVGKADRAVAVRRVVEFDVSQGNEAAAKALIERALQSNIEISYEDPQASRLHQYVAAEYRAEQERVSRETAEARNPTPTTNHKPAGGMDHQLQTGFNQGKAMAERLIEAGATDVLVEQYNSFRIERNKLLESHGLNNPATKNLVGLCAGMRGAAAESGLALPP